MMKIEGNFVRFNDAIAITPLDISDEVKDYYATPENLQTTPLRCRIAATHSGRITSNNGFYLPDRMRKGTSTFTAQYAKPVLIHHDAKRDAIGRVISANYVDLTTAIRDSGRMTKLRDACEDLALLDAFVLGKMETVQAIDFAREYLINDLTVSADPDYEGLGFIELVADITDPSAVAKILDKRYLTGSTGAATNSATCSVCKTDWAVEGKCEHKPGKIYDNAKCVIIAGDLVYSEYSFVNKPADAHSGVIEVNIGGVQDMVQVENHEEDDTNKSERVYEVVFVHDSVKATQSQEDESMTFKDAFERISALDFFKGLEGLEDAVKAVIDNKEISDEDREKDFARLVAVQLGKVEDYDAAHPVTETPADASADDASSDDASSTEDAETEQTPADKVAALEALLAQAKALVTEAPADADTTSTEEPVTDDAAADEPNPLQVTVDELTQANDALTSKVTELETKLTASRKEVGYLHADIENLTNSVADSLAEVRTSIVQRVTDFRILDGQEVDFQTVSDELKDKSTDDIRETVKELTDKVDTKKIAGTLNSGLSNTPEGEVEDPTAVEDNVADVSSTEKTEVTGAMKNQIALTHMTLLRTQGETAAKKFIDSCKAEGLIEDDSSVEQS